MIINFRFGIKRTSNYIPARELATLADSWSQPEISLNDVSEDVFCANPLTRNVPADYYVISDSVVQNKEINLVFSNSSNKE